MLQCCNLVCRWLKQEVTLFQQPKRLHSGPDVGMNRSAPTIGAEAPKSHRAITPPCAGLMSMSLLQTRCMVDRVEFAIVIGHKNADGWCGLEDPLGSFRLLVVGFVNAPKKNPRVYLRNSLLPTINLQWLSNQALASSCAKTGRVERLFQDCEGVSGVLL